LLNWLDAGIDAGVVNFAVDLRGCDGMLGWGDSFVDDSFKGLEFISLLFPLIEIEEYGTLIGRTCQAVD
jgi:hypothetical protein